MKRDIKNMLLGTAFAAAGVTLLNLAIYAGCWFFLLLFA